MNTKNLSVGMIIPNYKKLCELLGVEYKTGNTRIYQLKDLERYCVYEKDKHKFIIKQIYEKPLPKSNNITQYIPIIEKLILHIIIRDSDENNRLYITKSKLLNILYMLNENYAKYKYKQLTLKKDIEVSKQSVYDFYSSSDEVLQRNLERALNSLANQSLVKWSNVFTVDKLVEINEDKIKMLKSLKLDKDGNEFFEYGEKKKTKHIHLEATKDETDIILGEQRKLLLKLELDNLDAVYKAGKYNQFHDEVKRELTAKYNIANYYESYAIIFNREYVIKQYEALDRFILDYETQKELSMSLNEGMTTRTKELGEARHNKAKSLDEDKKEYVDYVRCLDNYIVDTNKLSEYLIKRYGYSE